MEFGVHHRSSPKPLTSPKVFGVELDRQAVRPERLLDKTGDDPGDCPFDIRIGGGERVVGGRYRTRIGRRGSNQASNKNGRKSDS